MVHLQFVVGEAELLEGGGAESRVRDHEQLSVREVLRGFRGGLVFKAHSILYHSTLGLRVINKKRKKKKKSSLCEKCCGGRSRVNSAHITQSRPDSGPGFQVKALKTFYVVPSTIESGV